MEKKELKQGMFVELRNGVKTVVVGDNLVGKNGKYQPINTFDNELCASGIFGKTPDYDVVKVYKCKCFNDMERVLPVWVRNESKLDKEEKEYLSAVIKPFRNRLKYIAKETSCNPIHEYICIHLNDGQFTDFPYFDKGEMYKGMEADRKYTLKELGL